MFWTQQIKYYTMDMTLTICNNRNYFGHSVDIYDDTIVIGEPGGRKVGIVGVRLNIQMAQYMFSRRMKAVRGKKLSMSS